jgi:hypothetical protein
MLCVFYMRKDKSNMCFVYVTWRMAKVICFVYVTWGRTTIIIIMCLLHDEGPTYYVLCACEMRKSKIIMCFVYVTWGRPKLICIMCMLHEEGQKKYVLCVCYMRKDKSNVLRVKAVIKKFRDLVSENYNLLLMAKNIY